MALVTWDAMRELDSVGSEMDRFLAGVLGQGSGERRARRWTPALDVHEEADRYVLRMDLPGLHEEDVTVEVDDRVLRIAGERRREERAEDEGWRRVERAYGAFERSLTLPEGVDASAIAASFERGVLELAIPKPEQVRPTRIRINGAASEVEGVEVAAGADA